MHYFGLFSKKISKPYVKFSCFLTNNNCLGNFSEKYQKFLCKQQKNALFWSIFKKISKACVKFSRAMAKNVIPWGIFEIVLKNLLRKQKKCTILAYSQQIFKTHRYFFEIYKLDEKYKLLGKFEKILKFFDKNSLEKLNFYLFLEKLLLKIEPSEIPSFFSNSFYNFGVGTFRVSPLPAPLIRYFIQEANIKLSTEILLIVKMRIVPKIAVRINNKIQNNFTIQLQQAPARWE